MNSFLLKTTQSDLSKIDNLEKTVSELLSIGKVASTNDLISIRGSARNPVKEYYIVSIDSGANESHSVLAQVRKNEVRVFDSNGQFWANKLVSTIKVNGVAKKADLSLSPEKSWNNVGLCTLWSIVIAILMTSAPQNKRKFYRYLNRGENAELFISSIFRDFIKSARDNFTTASSAEKFRTEVVKRIKKC